MNSSRRLRLDLARYYRLPSVQVSLGVVLAFMITAFFIMFAIRPTFATIVKLQKSIEESRKTLKDLDAKVNALTKAATLLEKIKPQLPKLETSIPPDGMRYDELAYNLEALAQNTETTLESFTLGSSLISSRLVNAYTPNKKQEVVPTPITIKIKGTYPQVSAYLTRLASTIRLTAIDSVAILKDGAGSRTSDSGILTMTISGSVYYAADPAAIQKVFPKEGGK